MRNKLLLCICGTLLGLGLFYSFWEFSHSEISQSAHEPIGLPEVNSRIAARGEISPESGVISLYPRRSDVVAKVFVKEGDVLKAGDPVYQFCSDELERQKTVCAAAIEIAKAKLQYLEEQPRSVDLIPLKSEIMRFSEDVARLEKHWTRANALLLSHAVSQSDCDEANGLFRIAGAALQNSRDRYEQLKAGPSVFQKLQAKAEIDKAAAEMSVVERQIENSTVRAPTDGRVLEVNIHPGEYISLASFSLTGEQYTKPPVSFASGKLQLLVEVDELFVPRIHSGCFGEAYAPGIPERKYSLRFNRFVPRIAKKSNYSNNPDEIVNVKVLRVIFDFDEVPDAFFVGQRLEVLLFPEMTKAEVK